MGMGGLSRRLGAWQGSSRIPPFKRLSARAGRPAGSSGETGNGGEERRKSAMRITSPLGKQRLLRRSRATKVAAAVLGVAVAGGVAYGATFWLVGLNSGSSGQARSGSVSNLTITAIATPTPTNYLYPHGAGDVIVKITNPNHFPVTITKVKLPKSTVYAVGYTTSSLTSAKTGCGATATGSDVTWHYSSATTGSSHTLNTALTVAATGQSGDPLTVTLTDDGDMGTTASTACEGIYFKLPALVGVTAYGGGAVTPASSPATDKWTS